MGCISSFYSFKGGVGRTFVLANVAAHLARTGRRVLAMDWDLEAPGLDRYFGEMLPPGGERRGMIHALHDAVHEGAERDPHRCGRSEEWMRLALQVRIPERRAASGAMGTIGATSTNPRGELWLIPAGASAPGYTELLHGFSWPTFFERGGGAVLERWRAEWKRRFDVILIDSRTGFTDTGGVCTILLPDFLVLVMTANVQNLEGCRRVADAAKAARRNLDVERPPLVILPLLSRFDGREEVEDAQRWLTRVAEEVGGLYDTWLPAELSPRRAVEVTKIPYVAKFTFGEPLPVITHGTTDMDGPGFFLARAAELIAGEFKDVVGVLDPSLRDALRREVREAIGAGQPQPGDLGGREMQTRVRLLLDRLSKGDEALRACVEVGNELHVRGELHAAEALFTAVRDATATEPSGPTALAAGRGLAAVYTALGRLDKALAATEEIIAILERLGSGAEAGVAYQLLGSIAQQRGDLAAAEAAYEQSAALRRRAGDEAGEREVALLLRGLRDGRTEARELEGRDRGYIERLTLAPGFKSPAFKSPAERAALERYLRFVVEKTRLLDLTGVDVDSSGLESVHPELDAIYVPLDTTNVRWLEERTTAPDLPVERIEPCSAVEFVHGHPHAVLLGDPGSGKSTFANVLALGMASELLGDAKGGLARVGAGWSGSPQVPIRVVLRELAASGRLDHPPADRLWDHFIDGLPRALREAIGAPLKEHLRSEGGIFILDGYDEAPEAERHRLRVRESVLALRNAFPRARILVTSRVYAYQREGEQGWRLPGFDDATLAPFTTDQQDAFVDRWYTYSRRKRANLGADEATGRAEQLKQAIAQRSDLRPLAERPLLLTLMASLHASRHGVLPAGREGLYEASFELLLNQWQRPKFMADANGRPKLLDASAAEFLRVSPERIMRALERLAYEAHRDQERRQGEADIPIRRLVDALVQVAGVEVDPAKIVEYVRDRAGLLIDIGGDIVRFPHRTFQEYLAARHLCNEPDELVEHVLRDHERWREAFLLAGARTAKTSVFHAWLLVQEVLIRCDKDDPRNESLCGQMVVESELHRRADRDRHLATLKDLRRRLTRIVESGLLAPVERAATGEWLAWIGDERPGVGVKGGIPMIDWITVPRPPGGAYELAKSGEKTVIAGPFRVARYPVTVAQYDAFLKATGRPDPRPLADRFAHPNKPRVNVSWDDAQAFCAWLGELLRAPITLPTEAQWEYAASGVEHHEYPWGPWQPAHANTRESGIGATSTVGTSPGGKSWCGALDMAGNVWEWCLDRVGSDERARVVRGGSWYDLLLDFARCAFRYWYVPDDRDGNVGFRVCVCPFSPSDL